MNFNELVEEVLGIVRRPDLQTRVESAVKQATLKAHHRDFFYKDLIEITVAFDTPAYISNFLPTDVVTRFRKAKYLRIWNGESDGYAGKFIQPIQIENAFDGYDCIKEDVFYMAGQLLQIRTKQPLEKVLFGCYQHPSIVPASYASWIAVEEPYAIIHEAARVVFGEIGMDAQASRMANFVAEHYRNLTISYVDDTPVT